LSTNRWISVQPWHIAALAAVGGVVNAFNMPAQQAFVTDMVEERHALGNAIALNSLMFNMARFVGPILAGAVLVRFGAAWCFALNGLSFIAVIASLMLMRLAPFEPRERKETVWSAFAFIRGNTKVFRVISLVGAASLFAWSFSTLLPVFAERFHRGASGFTMLMTANGVGAALGGLAVATLAGRLHRKLMIYASLTFFCAGLFLFTTATEFWVAMGWLLFSGFSMISFAINANTKVQEDVPDSLRGRVMAIYSMVFFGLMPLGGLEVGFLAERMGVSAAVRLNLALCLLATAALWAWSRAEEAGTALRVSG
jgi:MFS family permease